MVTALPPLVSSEKYGLYSIRDNWGHPKFSFHFPFATKGGEGIKG